MFPYPPGKSCLFLGISVFGLHYLILCCMLQSSLLFLQRVATAWGTAQMDYKFPPNLPASPLYLPDSMLSTLGFPCTNDNSTIFGFCANSTLSVRLSPELFFVSFQHKPVGQVLSISLPPFFFITYTVSCCSYEYVESFKVKFSLYKLQSYTKNL